MCIVDYLNPPGFLGTGASLLADITLLAYILLIVPGMVLGFIFARTNRHRPHHRNLMIAITVVNWILILWVMIVAFRFDVAGNIGSQPTNPRYLFPSVHSILGLIAQLLATYVVYRMIREDTQVAAAKKRSEENLSRYWFTSAKTTMRLVLGLWLVTAVLGIANYVVRYNVVTLSSASGDVGGVVTTQEAASVLTTEEATTDVSATPAASGSVTITVAAHPTLGNILADGQGRILYVYANDEVGWSNCVDACLTNWEVYILDRDAELTLGEGLSGEIGLTERADGTFQVMYNTQPLYRFRLDQNPGDALGNGVDNLWSVVVMAG
jgi:predicted lipoprotein with Yx(FWY)xxD motif